MSVDEIAAAVALQKIGKDFGQIAHMLGVHINAIKAQLDAPYLEMCRENARKMREHRMRAAYIAARNFRLRPDTRDVTGIICGDPVFERSALAEKLRRA